MNPWTPTVLDDMRQKVIQTYEFVAFRTSVQLTKSTGGNNADTGVFLSNYEDSHEIDGNEYVPRLLLGAAPPPVTGKLDQEVQRIIIAQARTAIGGEDFVAALGPFYGARVELTSYPFRDGVLRSGNDFVWRSVALLKGIDRDTANNQIQLEITNSFGQLRQVRSLRTTQGSLKRLSATDTSFNRATDLSDSTVLQWGSDPGDD